MEGYLNFNEGTLNLDGRTLSLDGGTRPPYNLSTDNSQNRNKNFKSFGSRFGAEVAKIFYKYKDISP